MFGVKLQKINVKCWFTVIMIIFAIESWEKQSEAKKAGHYDERYQNMIDVKGLKLFIYTSQEKHVINDEKDEGNWEMTVGNFAIFHSSCWHNN